MHASRASPVLRIFGRRIPLIWRSTLSGRVALRVVGKAFGALKVFATLEDSYLRVHLLLHHDCSGRPSSMYVWSPRDIGRESWVWEEQEALWMVDSPHKVGEEALAEWIPLSEGNGAAPG